jgi:hypothetical protein
MPNLPVSPHEVGLIIPGHNAEPGGTSRALRILCHVKSRPRKFERSVELPGVSEQRPLAFPIASAPKSKTPVFVYSPLRGEWTIAVRQGIAWLDRASGEEVIRPTHWMPLPD